MLIKYHIHPLPPSSNKGTRTISVVGVGICSMFYSMPRLLAKFIRNSISNFSPWNFSLCSHKQVEQLHIWMQMASWSSSFPMENQHSSYSVLKATKGGKNNWFQTAAKHKACAPAGGPGGSLEDGRWSIPPASHRQWLRRPLPDGASCSFWNGLRIAWNDWKQLGWMEQSYMRLVPGGCTNSKLPFVFISFISSLPVLGSQR